MGALVTEEELQLVKSYIMLPMILTAFERDIQKIESTLKTLYPYTEAIKLAMEKATYKFRGYHGEMLLLNDFLRAECMKRTMAYMRVDKSNKKPNDRG